MIPSLAAQYGFDKGVADAHPLGNLPAFYGGIQGASFADLFARQLICRPTIPALLHLITHVLKRCSLKKVGGVTARRIVARVKSQWLRPLPMSQSKSDAMSHDGSHSHPHSTVSILAPSSNPRPTGINATGLVNLRPVPLIGIFKGVCFHVLIVADGVS